MKYKHVILKKYKLMPVIRKGEANPLFSGIVFFSCIEMISIPNHLCKVCFS